jgi:leucine dehydrogenase
VSVKHETTELMAARGHEQVVFVADAATGLRAVIAIHSTALGPSLGGVRFWHYDEEADAVADVLRLSEAMTYKAAVAGLDQGGGKTVVMVDDPDRPREEALLAALGRAIDELGGRYLAAEDVGATPRDMDLIARVTPWVTGLDESLGGSGDPSPVTAVGVRAGMRAVRDALDATRALDGLHVVVHGTGHVGSHLARLLAADGVRLTLADRAPGRAEALAAELGAAVVAPDDALDLECDVLAPCALGPVIDLDRGAFRVVLGLGLEEQDTGLGADVPAVRVLPELLSRESPVTCQQGRE